MSHRTLSMLILFLLQVCSLIFTISARSEEAFTTIFIRADGSVDPSSAPITSLDNVSYFFTDNCYAGIKVERSNIVLDGNGYTLEGEWTQKGFELYRVDNVTIQNINLKNFEYSIYLYSSSFNVISGSTLTNNYMAICLYQSSYTNICGNTVKDNDRGIKLISSYCNTLSENTITCNNHAIYLESSPTNILAANTVNENSGYGIYIYNSVNNSLSGNIMADNSFNLHISGTRLQEFKHQLTTSNTVNGKNVYYLVGQSNLEINPVTHSQIGYLALVKCDNITIAGFDLSNNGQGILLAYTTHSKIVNNTLKDNDEGIWLSSSSFNNLTGNILTGNDCGIYFDASHLNTISGNNIKNGSYGIYFCWSSRNNISCNLIVENDCGILLHSCKGRGSQNNRFFHNSFINNERHAHFTYCAGTTAGQIYPNIWHDDYPSGGNFWSDYMGVDMDNDGIGDSPYIIDANNRDSYPLMAPQTPFEPEEGEFLGPFIFYALIAGILGMSVTIASVTVYKKRRPKGE